MVMITTHAEAERLGLSFMANVTASDNGNYVASGMLEQLQAESAMRQLESKADEMGATHLVITNPPMYQSPGLRVAGVTTVIGVAYKAVA